MTEAILRREIKKALDRVPADRLPSLADYVAFLNPPTLGQQIQKAEPRPEGQEGDPLE